MQLIADHNEWTLLNCERRSREIWHKFRLVDLANGPDHRRIWHLSFDGLQLLATNRLAQCHPEIYAWTFFELQRLCVEPRE
jgi:hypothetical protein